MTDIWPFWAATADERIEDALDLAQLCPGELLVDLGCGDGRVLLRAAEFRSARVRGVELDPDLARAAKHLLAEHGADGEVVEADLNDPRAVADACMGADVVFCYLSPAMLQRLAPTLGSLPAGTRVVTTGYPVPTWVPRALAGRAYRFDPPLRVVEKARAEGWEASELRLTVRAGTPSLAAVMYAHPGGAVELSVSSDPPGAIDARAGLDHSSGPAAVAVDVRVALPAPLTAAADAPAVARAQGAICIGDDVLMVHAELGAEASRQLIDPL